MILGLYFSGTGNTEYCIKKYLKTVGGSYELCSIEESGIKEKMKCCENIVFAYPIYFSSLPKIVRDFITDTTQLWKGKKIYIISTMGLFSGDGAGLSARLLKKYGAEVVGGLHLKMPDCIADDKRLKKPLEKNKEIVKAAECKIQRAAEMYSEGKPTKEGLSVINHMAGLFGQRLYFYNKTRKYSDKIKIDNNKCVRCKKCIKSCPMENLKLEKGSVKAKERCTMCYRCINNCPQKAITLLGDKVVDQSLLEKFV